MLTLTFAAATSSARNGGHGAVSAGTIKRPPAGNPAACRLENACDMNCTFDPGFRTFAPPRRGRQSKMLFLQRNKKLVAATTQALGLVYFSFAFRAARA